MLSVLFTVQAQQIFSYEQNIPLQVGESALDLAWAGGLNSGQYYNIDIDRDGQQDLIIFDRTSNQFLPFVVSGDTYKYAPDYSLLMPPDIKNWVVFADYDGDGKKDLFTASGKRSIILYKNTSTTQLEWEMVANPILAVGFSGSQVAIQAKATDIPAIEDIDNDGDLDILVYDASASGQIELYLNDSQSPGEFAFVAADQSWGSLIECDCGLFAFGEDDCEDVGARKNPEQAKQLHLGAKTILALDVDGDGDKDIFTSDEGCGELYFLENVGTVTNALFESFSRTYPEGIPFGGTMSFPSAYYVDVTQDNVRDLVVAPNIGTPTPLSTDLTNTSWLFENRGTDIQPEFELTERAFLQSAMLDVGADASPTLADYDADGDFDLFVGQMGKVENGEGSAGVSLYENMGTTNDPRFSLQTSDYLGIKELGLFQIQTYFEDVNGDGLPDMIVSGADNLFTRRATVYYLSNQAAVPGESWVFDKENRQTITIDINPKDRLAFSDADKDGDLDLLVGRREGNLVYFENEGSEKVPNWQLSDEEVGDISGSVFRRNLSILLYDFNKDGEVDLLSSDASGILSLRPDFLSQIEDTELIVDTVSVLFEGEAKNIKMDNSTWMTAGPLDSSGKVYVLVGSPQGGIRMLSYDAGRNPEEVKLIVFPNPVSTISQEVKIKSTIRISQIELINMGGSVVFNQQIAEARKELNVNLQGLAAGVYLLRVLGTEGKASSAKLIVL